MKKQGEDLKSLGIKREHFKTFLLYYKSYTMIFKSYKIDKRAKSLRFTVNIQRFTFTFFPLMRFSGGGALFYCPE